MAVVKRVRRLANPSKRKRKARRSNPRRRKLTAKQIKYFGSKRQKAALKAASKRKRTRKVAKAANPRRKRTRRTNPAMVITLGAMNPQRRKKMARKTRRRSNPRRKRSRKATMVVTVPKRSYRRRRRAVSNPRRRRHARRNPFGGTRVMSAKGIQLVLGGLAGVAATKFIPRLIPATLTGGMGNLGAVVVSGVSAWASGMLATRALGPEIGQAVLFGGLMQAGSVALNMLLPGFQVGGVPIALSGMGDLLPGQFVVPQNPLRLPPPPAPAPTNRVTMNGLNRAYGAAF